MKRASFLSLGFTAALLFSGCHMFDGRLDPGTSQCVAVLSPTAGNSASGTVLFTQEADGVSIEANVQGLTANQKHAIHIHEYGDIRLGDGKGTGGHYNPEGHPHALPSTASRHAGDLGNLQADGSGHAHYQIKVDNISLFGPRNPIVGRGVIVHAKMDDGGQPTGNAGARIAQGVIGIVKPSGS